MADTVTLRVFRYSPEDGGEPRWQDYEVERRHDWTVLDAINWVKGHVDGTLSYRWSCRMGICGSCGMNVDGYPKLTCAAHLREYGKVIKVEPLANFPVVRDLVVDIDDFVQNKLPAVQPWIIRQTAQEAPSAEYLQSQAQVDEYYQFSSCINCMLCYAACPVYGLEPSFLGPAAIALARRYNLDSRDEGRADRLPALAETEGIWECSFVGECSRACPKGVDPAKAIQQTKFDTVNDRIFDTMLMPFGGRKSG